MILTWRGSRTQMGAIRRNSLQSEGKDVTDLKSWGGRGWYTCDLKDHAVPASLPMLTAPWDISVLSLPVSLNLFSLLQAQYKFLQPNLGMFYLASTLVLPPHKHINTAVLVHTKAI